MGIETSKKHMKMWNKKRNTSPNGIGFFNQSKKYWWICDCGVEWESFVISITRRKNIGCKKCIKKNLKHIAINEIYGKWRIVERAKSGLWTAECLGCNKTSYVRGDNLKAGMTKKCLSCHANETRKKYPIAHAHWKSIQDGAKNRGLTFNVTMESIYSLFLKQGGKCALTGDSLHLCFDNKEYKLLSPGMGNYASLDRIDNHGGYEIENLQWVRKDINLLRGSVSVEKFVQMANKVSNYAKDDK